MRHALPPGTGPRHGHTVYEPALPRFPKPCLAPGLGEVVKCGEVSAGEIEVGDAGA